MKMSEVLSFACIIIIFVTLLVVVNQRDTLKKQAVEKGYAAWVVTPEGNATRNTEYYNSAYEAIEQYKKLKDANR